MCLPWSHTLRDNFKAINFSKNLHQPSGSVECIDVLLFLWLDYSYGSYFPTNVFPFSVNKEVTCGTIDNFSKNQLNKLYITCYVDVKKKIVASAQLTLNDQMILVWIMKYGILAKLTLLANRWSRTYLDSKAYFAKACVEKAERFMEKENEITNT